MLLQNLQRLLRQSHSRTKLCDKMNAPDPPRRSFAPEAAEGGSERLPGDNRDPRGTAVARHASSGRQLVAAITRTSTLRLSFPPRRCTSPCSRNLRILLCSGMRHVANFIEEKGSPVRSVNAADPRLDRSRKRPLRVAEEFRLEQRLRNRGTIHHDKGLISPRS